MEDKLQPYRQPLITATGIILGFSLNVAASWLPNAFRSPRLIEFFMALGTLIHIPIYTIVIFRMLRRDYPREKAESYYKKTLILFVAGISFFYLTMICIMMESYLVNRH